MARRPRCCHWLVTGDTDSVHFRAGPARRRRGARGVVCAFYSRIARITLGTQASTSVTRHRAQASTLNSHLTHTMSIQDPWPSHALLHALLHASP